ncbi:MAG: hypothetical protein WKG07_17910 [Hymenobacter sp.]
MTSAPVISAAPVVVPTVLFKLGKPELLPEASPALDQLAATLRERPALRPAHSRPHRPPGRIR